MTHGTNVADAHAACVQSESGDAGAGFGCEDVGGKDEKWTAGVSVAPALCCRLPLRH